VYTYGVKEKGVFNEAKRELLEYVADMFSRYSEAKSKLQFYSRISHELQDDDSVISFNWDCLLDSKLDVSKNGRALKKSLRELTNPVYGINTTRPGEVSETSVFTPLYLKLHGSVMHAACKDSRCILYETPFLLSDDEMGGAYQPCPHCGSETEIYLMPPHVHKNYETRRYNRLQANLAAGKLRTASEIVAVGYSFPQYDFMANIMFRIARLERWEIGDSGVHLRRINIVNPSVGDEEYVRMLRNLFGIDNQTLIYGHEIEFKLFRTADEYVDSTKI
jgi:hypothetical protein